MLRSILFVCLLTIHACSGIAQEGHPVSIDQGTIWSPNKKATLSREGDVYKVVNFDKDWAVSSGKQYPVQPGDIIQITGKAKVKGKGNFLYSVVARSADGKVVDWTYGLGHTPDTKDNVADCMIKFTVPRGIVSIEPRLHGQGEATIHYSGFQMKRIGRIKLDSNLAPLKSIENKFLKIAFSDSDERFAVHDKRSGRTWKPDTWNDWLVVRRRSIPRGARFTLFSSKALIQIDASATLEKDAPEILVQIAGKGKMERPITYPVPFETKQGDRIILPANEGLGIPVDEEDISFEYMPCQMYSGHGLCMSFFGVAEDATGIGYMGLVETANDASASMVGRMKGNLIRPYVRWESQKKEFGYPRTMRLVFFDKGGHVAIAKRYREYAKSIGRLVTFKEKIERNPKLKDGIDKLLGAANIWAWGYSGPQCVKTLQEAGIDRILWSNGKETHDTASLSGMENVLTGRYDYYADIMHPDMYPDLEDVPKSNDWEAWPRDIVWTDTKGNWAKGWAIGRKDGSRIPCSILCDLKTPGYVIKKIDEELKTKRYDARFLDVVTASAWHECWHPDHPMTRSVSKKACMDLLEMIGKKYGLVCGSETGHDAAVPYCDYFEGMLSFVNYRIHDAGRNMHVILEDGYPDHIEKIQLGEKYRLPLWELVYHDCCVAMWYWGDYNNKMPKLWWKRDLFNALYGTPPMYMFYLDVWNKYKDRFEPSAKVAMPVARLTAYREMLDHRILKPDRTVQQTVFEGGIVVTVNFGDTPFKMKDGFQLEGKMSRIER